MSEPETPAPAVPVAPAKSQRAFPEVVVAVVASVAAVLCCLCVTIGWACHSSNERAVAEVRAKSEAVQAMVDAGRPQQEINQLLTNWNSAPSANLSPGDRRAELVRSLQQRNVPPAEIIKIVSLCYPEGERTKSEAERAKSDAEQPKPTADEKTKTDAERSKPEPDERTKSRSASLPQ
jgi:hypothetical protein